MKRRGLERLLEIECRAGRQFAQASQLLPAAMALDLGRAVEGLDSPLTRKLEGLLSSQAHEQSYRGCG